jgi:hypothetical protein
LQRVLVFSIQNFSGFFQIYTSLSLTILLLRIMAVKVFVYVSPAVCHLLELGSANAEIN